MSTKQSKKYSLWLLLHGEAHDRFARSIQELAGRFCTPVFAPHLTLYSGIRDDDENAVIAQCRKITMGYRPVELHMESVGMEGDRFHSLFVRVRKTRELDGLFRRAREAFGGEQEFYPHISLLYGVIGNSEKEQALRGRNDHRMCRADSRVLALYDTTGDVGEWREVAAFPLAER